MDYRHVALIVSDLRSAEGFYRDTFDMSVLGRETWGEDGQTYALRPDKGWGDAADAGVEIQFVALRRDNVVLALIAGDATAGQVFALGLVTSADEIGRVRRRLADVVVMADKPDYLEFLDPFGLRWQLTTSRDFLHAGEIANRWVDI